MCNPQIYLSSSSTLAKLKNILIGDDFYKEKGQKMYIAPYSDILGWVVEKRVMH